MSGWIESCSDANMIEINGDSWLEPISYLTGSGGIGGIASVATMTRTHTPVTIEYVGLSLAAAKQYCADNPADTKYDEEKKITTIVRSCKWVRDGDGGCYKVIKETETITDWE